MVDARSESRAAWEAAMGHVMADADGADIAHSQRLWAEAVAATFPERGDVWSDGAAFGPVLLPGGRVVHRPGVAVVASDLSRALESCRSAWVRFQRVDADGIEHPDDGGGEAPDPFGHPALVGGQVLVGVDTRADPGPYPHRAAACLLILAEELRAHGCVPCSITSAPRGGGDEGTHGGGPQRRHTVPREYAAAEDVEPPAWLPAFHRVERARIGLPTVPVPFVMVVRGWALAWDPGTGLLSLPGRDDEVAGRVTIRWDCLPAGGTVLHYERGAGPDPADPPPGYVEYDLATGERCLVPYGPNVATAEGGWPRLWHECRSDPQRLVLVRASDEGRDTGHPLPVTDELLGDLTGPPAQFSPDGALLLTSHRRASGGGQYVAITDVAQGVTRCFEGVEASGSASWSPDGARCLVSSGPQQILDVRTGERMTLDLRRFGSDDVPGRGEARALGWLDDGGLLVRQSYGTRVRLSYQPLGTAVRFPVLDLPTGNASAYDAGIYLAAHVVQRAPGTVGSAGG